MGWLFTDRCSGYLCPLRAWTVIPHSPPHPTLRHGFSLLVTLSLVRTFFLRTFFLTRLAKPSSAFFLSSSFFHFNFPFILSLFGIYCMSGLL